MKINFSGNIYKSQLLIIFLIFNISPITILSLISLFHNRYEENIMREFIQEIKTEEINSKNALPDILNNFVTNKTKEGTFEISLFNDKGMSLFSSSRYLPDFYKFIGKVNLNLEKKEFYIHKHYRFVKYNPNHYLAFKFEILPPPPLNILDWDSDTLTQVPFRFFLFNFFFLNGTLLIGILLTQRVMGHLISEQTKKVDVILLKIASGHTGKRLQKTDIEPINKLVNSFNSMISKIEDDIERLQSKDIEVNHLIQEISHDLKTPLTSIYLIAQNICEYYEHHQPGEIKKKMNLVSHEINYVSSMIESLLFLSLISIEKESHEKVDITQSLEFESHFIQDKYTQREVELEVQENILLNANEILIKRLIRNLLDNAILYSDSYVKVTLKNIHNMVQLIIENDGQTIKNKHAYGLRDKSRKVDTSDGLNISMGLGTVIISKVVDKYNAHLEILDRAQGGTKIIITFPTELG